ncbi:MAG: protein kinase [Muribaculaceae bacterium]|nr:protein kinase [Muribaculaceae bacterium]
MENRRIRIGRDGKNDIVVPGAYSVVSSMHAEIELDDNGQYVYIDHSTNGSAVGGKKLHNDRMTVVPGTNIVLAGRYTLDWTEVQRLLPASKPAEPELPESIPTVIGGGVAKTGLGDPLTSGAEYRPSNAGQRPSGAGMRPSGAGERLSGGQRPSGKVSQGPKHYAGELFNNRFSLVRRIGSGASASVWEARDTLADNMTVAVKIFSLSHGMDSYGYQNLQKEFVTVYNISQAYLLTPRYYDVCQGQPFLVMQYCSRGSASSLIGKATEGEVIKLLHDVASGLEYLHERNIVHQDIKPDNILIADNGDFMITDFGISATIDALNGSKEMSGGTRAYMGPERFAGINGSSSYIWSLGATAYEMATGDAPYGDLGGVTQSYGTAVPPIAQRMQPEVKEIIMSCLEKDPAKRPTAAQIRKKIDLYYETGGSWKRKNKAKTVLVVCAVAAVLLAIGAGAWIWDYNRVKSSYYADFVERDGVPVGIGKVDPGKRSESVMIQTQRGRVVRMANVNSAGHVVPYAHSKQGLLRFVDVEYAYETDGSLSGKTVKDQYGRELFRMKTNGNSVSFHRLDDAGTEMMLLNDMYSNFKFGRDLDFFKDYSSTYKFELKFDDDHHINQVRYMGVRQNATDKYGIGGADYEYDDRGLLASSQYIGADGKHTTDRDGVSNKKYKYDSRGDLVELANYDLKDRKAANGRGVWKTKLTRDEHGNVVEESYYGTDGKPVANKSIGAARVESDYDSRGMLTERRYYGVDGKLTPGPDGAAIVQYECDDNGYPVRVAYRSANGKPAGKRGSDYTVERYVYDVSGQPLQMRTYRESGGKETPAEDINGVFLTEYAYNDAGFPTTISFFDKREDKTMAQGRGHAIKLAYDDQNNVVSLEAVDINGKPASIPNEPSLTRIELVYDKWGFLTKQTNKYKGRVARSGNTLVAVTAYEYEINGKLKRKSYFDTDGVKPTVNDIEGVAYYIYDYDDKTGFLSAVKGYDASDDLVLDIELAHDSHGNLTKRDVKTNATGKPDSMFAAGPAARDSDGKYEYDPFGRVSKSTDRSGISTVYEYDGAGREVGRSYFKGSRKCAGPGVKHHKLTRVYDDRGNLKSERYADGNGDKVQGPNGYSRREFNYDGKGQLSKAKYYDQSDNFIGSQEYKYNDKGKPTSLKSTYPGPYRYTEWNYAGDGVTPRTRVEKAQDGSVVATSRWNDKTKKWQ